MAETDPYVAGVFYTGHFITTEFIQTFSELGVDRRTAVLVEISARPQVSQFVMHRSTTIPDFDNLPTVYAYFAIDTSGTLTAQSFPQQFSGKTDQWLSMAPPPQSLIFTDENLTPRYVRCTSSGTPTLLASATQPVNLKNAQFVGGYLEMIGEDGISIYRITVNSSNVISVTLNRTEPERNAPIYISNGHPFAFDGTHLWLEGLVSISDVQMGIDPYLGGFSGVTAARVGTIHLQLADGWFRYLIGQSWDSRDIEIKVGLTDEDTGLYRVILRAKTERAEANLDEIIITLRDHSIVLDKPVQTRTFAGTGVYEGVGDIAGTLKPLCYGFLRHVTPVLINEVSNVYMLHDGPIHEIFSVHQGGILMTNVGDLTSFPSLPNLLSWAPTQAQVDMGAFMTDYRWGTFRTATRPTGPLTVTLWGSTSVPKTTSAMSEVCRTILNEKVPELTINENDFDQFHTEQLGAVGLYITESRTVGEVLNDLVAPVGAVLHVNALDQVSVRRLRAREPVAAIGSHNLVDDVQLSRRNPPRPGSIYRIGHFKSWTVLNETDLLNTSSPNIRIFLQRELNYVNATWQGPLFTRLPVHDSASVLEYNTLLDGTVYAKQIGAFLEFRDHSLQHLYECVVIGLSFQIEIGDTVLFQLNELGVTNTKTGLVVEVTEKSITSNSEDLTQLLIWA